MVKVATYRPDQVQTQVVRQPRASGNIPRGGFGEAITKGVADLALDAADVKQRIDTTSAEEALVKFERDKNDLFFNPDTGYFNSQGRNAYDGASIATKALEDLKKKYSDSLDTNSRMMFDQTAERHMTSANVDIARHASKGLDAWEVATIKAQVENSVENASLYWNQPDKLRVQNQLGRQSVIDAAEREGIGAEATNERLQTFDSAFAIAAVNSATAHSAAEGQKALEDNTFQFFPSWWF